MLLKLIMLLPSSRKVSKYGTSRPSSILVLLNISESVLQNIIVKMIHSMNNSCSIQSLFILHEWKEMLVHVSYQTTLKTRKYFPHI